MCYLLVHVIWTIKKGGNRDMRKRRDTIPEHFNSAEESGEFWDTHSAGDYLDELEEAEMAFDIQKRTFLVPVDARIYLLAKKKA